MKEQYANVPAELTLDNLTPMVHVDVAGVIKWSNAGNNGVPRFKTGQPLNDILPGLSMKELQSDQITTKTSVDGVHYTVRSYPANDKEGTTLVLENEDILRNRAQHYVQGLSDLQMLLNSPYEGLVYIDENGVIQYVNKALAHYNKLQPEDLIGRRHQDYPIDENLDRIMQTHEYEPLAFHYSVNKKKMIAARRPVFRSGKFAGVFGRYISIDPKDIDKYGDRYQDLIAHLQTRDIMVNIDQAMMELHSYKEEFNQINRSRLGIDNIIGDSPSMRELKKRILMVCNSPSSVLITGDSGTGKELFAKAIHFHGDRSSYPLVKVNCAAIPDNLLESELFGYVEGAFTGARKGGKMGKFELANKGTIFLDEIGDMPLSMQAKLLRVLQEQEIERVGSENNTISIDVRVLSATNKDLKELVKTGSFREDLYYRLNVVNLHIPPLRDRMCDLPNLVNYIIDFLNNRLNRMVLYPTQEAMDLLMAYDWPGNTRELINVLETAMNFCGGSVIDAKDLPYFMHTYKVETRQEQENVVHSLGTAIEDTEKAQLIAVLKQCNGSRKKAAEVLQVSKATLWRLMKKHQLI